MVAYVVEVEFLNKDEAELFMDYVQREVPFDGRGRMFEREAEMFGAEEATASAREAARYWLKRSEEDAARYRKLAEEPAQ